MLFKFQRKSPWSFVTNFEMKNMWIIQFVSFAAFTIAGYFIRNRYMNRKTKMDSYE
ncbi:hypothetical protein [Desulfuribacillus stibiiarsenatis]|uniref:hypothetical protein n=1 Tax=Desulfuribacillus stibiiarsenatis TaxID=1390249 RepID=UPI0015B483A2|nr:hypothetical protein [Desulfuribacillus stibiiarsenatis]